MLTDVDRCPGDALPGGIPNMILKKAGAMLTVCWTAPATAPHTRLNTVSTGTDHPREGELPAARLASFPNTGLIRTDHPGEGEWPGGSRGLTY